MATDRLRTSPLSTEHLDEQTMLPERVRELMASGHTVEVVDRHLVVNDKPDDGSSGYIVAEIETTAEKRARDVDDDQDTLVPDGGCPIPMCPACETRMVTPPGEPRGSLERAASWECPECGRAPIPDGGRSRCVECGGWLPQVIDPGTSVYCPQCGHGQHIADGGQVLVDDLTVDDTILPVWGLDPYAEGDEIHVSALIAVSEHTGHTSLPEVGETVACETSDGEEFRGEVVSLGLEGQGGLALNARLIEGAEKWEDRL